MRKPILVLLPLLGALSFGVWSSLSAGPPQSPQQSPEEVLERVTSEVQIFRFGLMDAIRDPGFVVPMQVQVYNPTDSHISLLDLQVTTATGKPLAQVDLMGEMLVGDEGEVAGIHYLLERMDPHLSHRHNKRLFIPEEDRQPLSPEQEAELFKEVDSRVDRLRESGAGQVRNVRFEMDLGKLFALNSEPGTVAALSITLHYLNAAGVAQQAQASHRIKLLEPYMAPPPEYMLGRAGGSFLAGDLHVHNCHDQAIGGCPDCPAESFNITGSFTNPDLKPQFQALGFDWFSTTVHSYCINSDSEFDILYQESQNLDDANFQVLAGTELTTRETGPQTGSDIFDSVCTLGGNWFRGIGHMGGHGITTRKAGGQDGFLDNCDNPLFDQQTNIADTNAEGGFTIANHPGGDTISFNSTGNFRGLEAGAAYGTEIVNGGRFASNTHVAWWLARLREGKFTYPYSGSDTHDAAVDFGTVHTFVSGALTDASLLDALKSGNHYISNGPFLSVEIADQSGNRLTMGQGAIVNSSQIPPNYSIDIEVFYNVSGDSDVLVYQGTVGSGEVLVQTFNNVNGSGTLTATTTLPNTASTWYRAELFRTDATQNAYTSLVIVGVN